MLPSRSEWDAFRHPEGLSLASGPQEDPEDDSLQAKAAQALANCQKVARRKLEAEKRLKAQEEATHLKSLLGRDLGSNLTSDSLAILNTAALQVLVNHHHSRIEKLNEELVKLLLEKDELQVSHKV